MYWGRSEMESVLKGERHDGKSYVANPVELVFREQKQAHFLPEKPTITLLDRDLKTLIESFKSTANFLGMKHLLEPSAQEARIQAMKEHLEDMRKLVFARPV